MSELDRELIIAVLEDWLHQHWNSGQRCYLSGYKPGRAHVYQDELRAQIAALRAGGSAPQPQNWQPIETAPKDGTSVLGYWPVKNYGQMYWSRDEEPGWTDGEYTYLPTHWMPLPAPPAAPAGEQP